MSQPRYVVRGKSSDGTLTAYAFRHPRIETLMFVNERDVPVKYADCGTTYFDTIVEASEAYRNAGHLRDVHIALVADDGTETPLPPYEDALAQMTAADAALAALGIPDDGRPLAERIGDLGLLVTEMKAQQVDPVWEKLDALAGRVLAVAEKVGAHSTREAGRAAVRGDATVEQLTAGFNWTARTLAAALIDAGVDPDPRVDVLVEQAATAIRGAAKDTATPDDEIVHETEMMPAHIPVRFTGVEEADWHLSPEETVL